MPLNGGRSVGKESRKPLTDRQADGDEAEKHSAGVAPSLARFDCTHGEVAPGGGSRVFPVPRCTAQREATESVPTRGAAHVVVATSPAESTTSLDVEQISGETRKPAAGSRGSAPVS